MITFLLCHVHLLHHEQHEIVCSWFLSPWLIRIHCRFVEQINNRIPVFSGAASMLGKLLLLHYSVKALARVCR